MRKSKCLFIKTLVMMKVSLINYLRMIRMKKARSLKMKTQITMKKYSK